MNPLLLIVSTLFVTSSALAAEPKAVDKQPVASAPAASSTAQVDVRRKPYSAKAAATTGPGTQTEDDVYVGVKKKK